MGVIAAAGYLAGRASAPEKVKVEKEYVKQEVERSKENANVDQNKSVREVIRPDGTKITTTRTHTQKKSEKVSSIETKLQGHETLIVENNHGVLVSILAGASFTDLAKGAVYGASVSMPLPPIPIVGKLHVGGWVIPQLNWAFGASLGREF